MNIGITGHQSLKGREVIRWLKSELVNDIGKMSDLRGGYSSLAIGADQLFAKTILQMKVDLIAIIPSLGYEETFKGGHKTSYLSLLSKCKLIETLDFAKPSETAFLTAGKYVVDKSDVLFAIWDGDRAMGLGGTGDIVQYALSHQKTVIHLNPISREKIIHN
jgi:hypothetical protein